MKQMRVEEVNEVCGGFGPFGAAVGATLGTGSYLYSQYLGGYPITPMGVASSAVFGAVAGGVGAVLTPASAIWKVNNAMGAAITSGVVKNLWHNKERH